MNTDFFAELIPKATSNGTSPEDTKINNDDYVLPIDTSSDKAGRGALSQMHTLAQPSGSPMRPTPSRVQTSSSSPGDPDTLNAVRQLMKEFTGSLEKILEDIDHRLEFLENRTEHISQTVADLQEVSSVRDETNKERLTGIEKSLREVHRSVQIIRDKQELVQAAAELQKVTLSNTAAAEGVAPAAAPISALSSSTRSEGAPSTTFNTNNNGAPNPSAISAPADVSVAPSFSPQPPPSEDEQLSTTTITTTGGGLVVSPINAPPPLPPVAVAQPPQYPPQQQQQQSQQQQQLYQPLQQATPHQHPQHPQHPPPPPYGAMPPPPPMMMHGGGRPPPPLPPPHHALQPPPPPASLSPAASGDRIPPPPPGYRSSGLTRSHLAPPPLPLSQATGPPPSQQKYQGFPSTSPQQLQQQESEGAPPRTANVPIEKVIDDVSVMGFSREEVRKVLRDLMESGQSIDLNVVLDRLGAR